MKERDNGGKDPSLRQSHLTVTPPVTGAGTSRKERAVSGTVDATTNARRLLDVKEAAEYEGHPFVDIRTYWRTGDDDTWKPSKKGVTLKLGLVGELIALLQKANGT